ncbi:MAG: hypothetical protein MK085_12930, partial [Phycisphaerales bacterium]|nr:hypothetical protein [Phycisphaerales bacterium]
MTPALQVDSTPTSGLSKNPRLHSSQERQGDVLLLMGMHLWPLLGLMTGLFLPFMIAIPVICACLRNRSPLVDA